MAVQCMLYRMLTTFRFFRQMGQSLVLEIQTFCGAYIRATLFEIKRNILANDFLNDCLSAEYNTTYYHQLKANMTGQLMNVADRMLLKKEHS